MPDREKYIEILSKTAKTVKEFNEDTPIKISLECIEDILELLKEQEDLGTELTNAVELIRKKNERIEKLLKEQDAVEPEYEGDAKSIWWYVCGECHTSIESRDKYCRECGRKIKWK